MATLRTYRCKCGYEVQTEPTGHYGLFAGEFYNFRCAKCKEIITISADELASQRYFPTCPKCGAENEEIHNWNPIEGHCPKCGKKMQEVPGMIIMAD
ncbi:MAG: hypothetical protein U0L19_05700 [Bacteroidales bacterium]|jgi:DNA-directed RNA polymerase subunit RPC12/RpoP|nr:hypothetical protein [Bacteroidales bacterium]